MGQALIGIGFSVAALFFADRNGLTPASTRISFARDSAIDLAAGGMVLGIILFVLWANFLITAWSNAVNLTDGLDGLAAGACAMAFGAYTLIGVWQSNQSCQYAHTDTVATMALGGAFAGLSILTRTEFLAVVIGGLFLAEVLSDVIQVASFKATRKRVFRMAPIHHHFELLGWSEVNVVIRFWIVAGVCVVAGLGLFYAEYWMA